MEHERTDETAPPLCSDSGLILEVYERADVISYFIELLPRDT